MVLERDLYQWLVYLQYLSIRIYYKEYLRTIYKYITSLLYIIISYIAILY